MTKRNTQNTIIANNEGIIDSNGALTAGGTEAGILILIPL